MIRDATSADAESLAAIYNHYIENTVVTFEEQPISAAEMEQRFRAVTETLLWLVFEEDGQILGYAYAGPWHSRCAYRYSVEASVYLDHRAVGRGLGTRLYEALLKRLRSLPVHSVIGGIALPNAASVALHEKMGFVKVAHYRETGWKQSRWIDVGYWQLMLRAVDPVSGSPIPSHGEG